MKIRIGLLALIVSLPKLVAAQATHTAPPNVDFSVNEVASAGLWVEPKAMGYFRVIVVQEGSDTVRHRAFVEWIQYTTGKDSILQTVDLTGQSGAYSLIHPLVERDSSPFLVHFKASLRPMDPFVRDVVFEIGAPGQLRLIRGARAAK